MKEVRAALWGVSAFAVGYLLPGPLRLPTLAYELVGDQPVKTYPLVPVRLDAACCFWAEDHSLYLTMLLVSTDSLTPE